MYNPMDPFASSYRNMLGQFGYPNFPSTSNQHQRHHHHHQSRAMTPYGASGFDFSPITDLNNNRSMSGVATERDMWNVKQRIEEAMREMEMGVGRSNDYSSSLAHHPSRPGSMIEHYSLLNPLRIDGEGNRWLNCYFDMRGFKPEEIDVTLNSKERYIHVDASHEIRDKDHYIKRHYSRKVFVPDHVNDDLSKLSVKSCLTNDGLLCIEAALPKLAIEERPSSSKAVSTVPGNVYQIKVKKI